MTCVYLMDVNGLEPGIICEEALQLVDSDRCAKLAGRTGKPFSLSLAAGLLIQYAYLKYTQEYPEKNSNPICSVNAAECIGALSAAGHVEEVDKTREGRPFFPDHRDVFFSVSHSGDYAGCLVSDVQAGFDIQECRELTCDISGRFYPEDEDAYLKNISANRTEDFYDLWCLHEAFLKYTGIGLQMGMKDVSFLPAVCADDRGKDGSFPGVKKETVIDLGKGKKVLAQILQAPAGYCMGLVRD